MLVLGRARKRTLRNVYGVGSLTVCQSPPAHLCAVTYTETKKFSNTLQIRIFITEIHVEITQTE